MLLNYSCEIMMLGIFNLPMAKSQGFLKVHLYQASNSVRPINRSKQGPQSRLHFQSLIYQPALLLESNLFVLVVLLGVSLLSLYRSRAFNFTFLMLYGLEVEAKWRQIKKKIESELNKCRKYNF